MTSARKLFALLAALLFGMSMLTTVQAKPEREALNHAIQSTVLVLTLDNKMNVIATGSGSIIDSRGLILTNFHVVGDTEQGTLYNKKGLVGIALTRNLRQPAVPMFIAQVVRASPELDLSAVQVVGDIDGRPLNECLDLPTYTIGDSDALQAGDNLTAIGFPGLGGYSFTLTDGQVSGFEAAEDGTTVWMKTDAEISPGNSGGSAVSDDGQLIGVPTAGRINQEASSKIGLVRPINLAALVLTDLDQLDYGDCQASISPVFAGGTGSSGSSGNSGNSGNSGAETTEVTLAGRVVSADSGKAIKGAYFIILQPGVTWDQVDADNLEDLALDVAQSDRKGNFQTSEALDLSQPYSIGVFADGYAGVFGDNVDLSEYYQGESVIDLGDLGLKRE